MTLDTLGVAAGATPMQAGVIARDTAALLYGTDREGLAAKMMFDGRQVSIAGAAFAGATQIDNLDAHDGYNPTKGHIGVVVIPALIALAQTVPDMSGPEALATVAIGYEIAGRAALSLHATVSDYHTSGAWNALGVVAMAARLRKMDAEQLRHAMGIAEYHGPRSQMMREIANPTMLHDGSGWGAMAGISAAILAENGFTGAPAITIEGPEVAEHWQDLGRFWQMEHQYVKPYPICRWAHAPIDAVRALMRDHRLVETDISSIQINTFKESACLFSDMPRTTSQAQYSLPFAVAVQTIYGRIGLEHIEGAGLKDARVADLIKRISVSEARRYSEQFPEFRRADVVMSLQDGRVLESGTVDARGGDEDPLSEDEIIAKFHEFAQTTLTPERAASIRNAVLGLMQPSSRLSNLAPLLIDPV